MSALTLRPLLSTDETAFREAVREFRTSDPDWEFAFYFDENTDFIDYVRKLDAWSRGEELPGHFVPSTYLVAVIGVRIVGRLSLRHRLNAFLAHAGGHVGYGVVPSARRRGYATEILRQSLPLARAVGIGQMLVTCDDDNVGSYKVIEANGGVLENRVRFEGITKRRYWIDCR